MCERAPKVFTMDASKRAKKRCGSVYPQLGPESATEAVVMNAMGLIAWLDVSVDPVDDPDTARRRRTRTNTQTHPSTFTNSGETVRVYVNPDTKRLARKRGSRHRCGPHRFRSFVNSSARVKP